MTGEAKCVFRGAKCEYEFARIADANERADALVSMLAMIDEESAAEVARLLHQAKPTATRRRAAEMLGAIRGAKE